MTEKDIENVKELNNSTKNPEGANGLIADTLQSVIMIVKVLYQDKFIIASVTLIFAIFSIFYALSISNIYKSEALLLSNTTDGLEGSQVSALASFAGIEGNKTSVDDTTLAMAIFTSRKFVKSFLEDNNLIVPIMTLEGWNKETNEDIYSNSFDEEKGIWVGKKPTDGEIYNKFLSTVQLSKGSSQGIYTVSVQTLSPTFSQNLANKVINEINENVRIIRAREASENIEYLENQLTKTVVKDIKATLYGLIFEQNKDLMMAEVRKDFVFKVIDPAIVPEQKTYPVRSVICIIITLLGFFVAVSFSLIKHFYLIGSYQKRGGG
tara:strand:- start:5643 stop:6608 length:966 start_codon:yes stop_codon:yes gene_type:complete